MHGKQSQIKFETDLPPVPGMPGNGAGSPLPFSGGRCVDAFRTVWRSQPPQQTGEVMAVRHREYPVYGVQFHPESIMTPDGRTDAREILIEEV